MSPIITWSAVPGIAPKWLVSNPIFKILLYLSNVICSSPNTFISSLNKSVTIFQVVIYSFTFSNSLISCKYLILSSNFCGILFFNINSYIFWVICFTVFSPFKFFLNSKSGSTIWSFACKIICFSSSVSS